MANAQRKLLKSRGRRASGHGILDLIDKAMIMAMGGTT